MRPEKSSIVSDLAAQLNGSPFVLVADYQHMKVGDFSELRNRLATAGAEVHVIKNSYLKRAMTEAGFPSVDEKLGGQTAIVTGQNDVAPVAKILKMFATEFKKTALKVGLIERAIVSTAELEALADLPSREILQAQLLGLLLSPATKLVRLLNEPASALVRLLNAKAGKEGKTAEAAG
jgi:large subunit ribosomal protein L10